MASGLLFCLDQLFLFLLFVLSWRQWWCRRGNGSQPVQDTARDETTVPGPMLVIRVDRLGDFLLWLPSALQMAAEAGRRGQRLVFLLNQDNLPLADSLQAPLQGARKQGTLVRETPVEIWPLDCRRFCRDPLYRWKIARKVRALGASHAVAATFSRLSAQDDALVRFSGAGQRSGWDSEPPARPRYRSFFRSVAWPLFRSVACFSAAGRRTYSCLVPAPPPRLHESCRNELLPVALGIPLRPADLSLPDLSLPDLSLMALFPRAPAALTGSGLPAAVLPAGGYFLLAPGASQGLRCWPEAGFARLASDIHAATGLPGLLCGSRQDHQRGEMIRQLTEAPLTNLCGQLPLAALPALVAGCALLVGNDSAAVHLSALLQRPTLILSGGGHYHRFALYQPCRLAADRPLPVTVCHDMPCRDCNWRCHLEYRVDRCAPCVLGIDPAQVSAAALDLLAGRKNAGSPAAAEQQNGAP